MAIKVLICDDNPTVRLTLHRAFRSHGDVEIVAETTTGEDAVAAANDHHADVIIMDLHLPGIDGVEATRQLRAVGVEAPVILLSADDTAPPEMSGITRIQFLSKARTGIGDMLQAIREAAASSS